MSLRVKRSTDHAHDVVPISSLKTGAAFVEPNKDVISLIVWIKTDVISVGDWRSKQEVGLGLLLGGGGAGDLVRPWNRQCH